MAYSVSALGASGTASAVSTWAPNHVGIANQSLSLTAGFLTLDSAPNACLLAPSASACPSGLSIALWALVASAPAGSAVPDGVALVTSGAPLYPGLGIYIIQVPVATSGSGTLYELIFEVRARTQ